MVSVRRRTIKAIYAATTSCCLLPSLRTSTSSSATSATSSAFVAAASFLSQQRPFLSTPSISKPYCNTNSGLSTQSQAKNTSRLSQIMSMSSSSAPNAPSDVVVDDVPVASNLETVNTRISTCVQSCNRDEGSVRLVAVSKTKPVELLMKAYDAGQRHFGENYAQELVAKSESMPNDIHWHFIGPLQSNKAAAIVKALGLDKLPQACVETVSTIKLANKLNNAVANLVQSQSSSDVVKLGIYLQINTSGEESKSGLNTAEEACALALDIKKNCPNLSIRGLMTIGAPGDYSCFDSLVEYRTKVLETLELSDLELSMGMSGDFEEAIRRGATSVRVGSTIFGARDYSQKN